MKSIFLNMKKTVVVLALSLSTGLVAMAQQPAPGGGNGENRGEKIEALKIAFITQRLNLTPEEAQKFWPVFNQYESEMKTLRQNFKLGPGNPEPTAEQSLDFEQKKLDLKKKYKPLFEGALGKEKVNTLYHLEDEFRQKLKELRDQRMQNRGQNPPPGGGGRPGGPR